MKSILLSLFTVFFIAANAGNIGLYSVKESGKAQFAVHEIESALKIKGIR